MDYIETFPEERVAYYYSNPFQEELGRLAEYQGIITIPRKYYVAAPRASLVANNYHVGISRFKRVILESLPRVGSISPIAEAKLAIRSLAPHSHTINHPAVSLVHRQASNYGHWLMDYLPRALAALHFRQETGAKAKVIVPDPLSAWQIRSLELIGIEQEDLIPISMFAKTPLKIKLDLGLFSRSHSFHSDPLHGCRDALSPLVFSYIKDKMLEGINVGMSNSTQNRVFILRKSSSSADRRFITNEDEIKKILLPYEFQFVYLEDLSLDVQISLFSYASHIISAHGSGLANLIFSERCKILEIFSSGHGIRPEYWQLAAMNHGQYSHIVVDTKPPFHDLSVPLDKIRQFLDLTL